MVVILSTDDHRVGTEKESTSPIETQSLSTKFFFLGHYKVVDVKALETYSQCARKSIECENT